MVDEAVKSFGAHSRELIRQLGLESPVRPNETIDFPSDLSMVPDLELGHFLSYWASMCAYANQKVAVLEGALVLAKCQYDQEFDLRMYSKTTGSVAERKVAVGASKTIRDMKTRVSVIEADLKVLKSVLIGYDLKNSAISREITRRHNERALRDG